MTTKSCPFCTIEEDIIAENEYCFAIYDEFPVSNGHVLIITYRHTNTYFNLRDEEKTAMHELLATAKEMVAKQYDPDGWNIGMNCGEAAGQTVDHFHCHLMPRYHGDMQNPSGGVRHCIKGKGYY